MVDKERVHITSAAFNNFKAFPQYSISLQEMNILVGPNNSGKSTILAAFRLLESGLRRARARNPDLVPGPNGERWGHRISEDSVPISLENIHTDYDPVDTTVTFRLSNGNHLHLYFPRDSGCYLIPNGKRSVRTASIFRTDFPVHLSAVPVLGPVEHREILLTEETVKRDLKTHRASRHFRNYWYYFPNGFEEFATLVARTWPGMEIQRPTKVDLLSPELSMFCLERRLSRELFWAGFGFQVWCQLLTHISAAQHASLLIVDEPEIYLHPDIQRQLLNILRDIGPDIILATHSSEIMAEADPPEIVLINKAKRSAERLKNIEGVQAALTIVGSVQNITLTKLARNRRVLFVEGLSDFVLLRRFAKLLGLAELSSGTDITPVEAEGFSSWERVRSTGWGIEKALGVSILMGAIYDRDFWCQEEINSVLAELRKHLTFAHVHKRKEIENYLLEPKVLERALRGAIAEREKRSNEKALEMEPIESILRQITQPLKSSIQGQYVAKRTDYLKSPRDRAVIAGETIELFESKWEPIEIRMEIVPGKEVLTGFRDYAQKRFAVSITDHRIINAFSSDEIPKDLEALLYELEDYRTKTAADG